MITPANGIVAVRWLMAVHGLDSVLTDAQALAFWRAMADTDQRILWDLFTFTRAIVERRN